jgi:hypothetical protein
MPFPNPDRNWQNFYFSHSTVRIKFSENWRKTQAVYPDRNQANQINPSPVPDEN